ncbi:MAG: hypothetical protein R3A11_06740 [Bdellovibrionota bacterium]
MRAKRHLWMTFFGCGIFLSSSLAHAHVPPAVDVILRFEPDPSYSAIDSFIKEIPYRIGKDQLIVIKNRVPRLEQFYTSKGTMIDNANMWTPVVQKADYTYRGYDYVIDLSYQDDFFRLTFKLGELDYNWDSLSYQQTFQNLGFVDLRLKDYCNRTSEEEQNLGMVENFGEHEVAHNGAIAIPNTQATIKIIIRPDCSLSIP